MIDGSLVRDGSYGGKGPVAPFGGHLFWLVDEGINSGREWIWDRLMRSWDSSCTVLYETVQNGGL